MFPGHYQYESYINSGRGRNEITVLFSGMGSPLERHNMGPAVHPYFLMHTVISGTGEFHLNGIKYKCGPGDTFFIFPGALFQYTADEHQPWSYVWAAFRGHRCGPLLHELGITPEQPIVRSSKPRRMLALYRSLRHTLRDSDRPALTDLKSAGLLRLLLHELAVEGREQLPDVAPAISTSRRQVERAMHWLELHYAQPISIEQLANSLGYHRTYLSKLFKQSIGQSPMQYLMQIRLEHARALLPSQLTIEQVAASVGFTDALYFSKVFRNRFGLSPTAYRERTQGL